MGNCLPVFGQHNDETPIYPGSTTNGRYDNTTSSRSSAYVNTLFRDNEARERSEAALKAKEEEIAKRRIQRLLEQIPADVYAEGMKHTECAICMDDFEEGDSLRFLPCGHAFHQSCIDDWLQRSFTCPSCQAAVDSTLLSSLTAQTALPFSALQTAHATVSLNSGNLQSP